MAIDNVFGSGDLTPELVRSVAFTERDGRYDATEVRTFLDRIASALEIFLAADAPSALRAEFRRNAEIAQQVLDAGQQAAEQLRRQAAEEARALLDDTRAATAQLRAGVEEELRTSHDQLAQMRGQLIADLRDLYDRIGASLYRFERADDDRGRLAAPAVTASEPGPIERVIPEPVVQPQSPQPPAWQQLVADQQLAEPEPLVDLRDMPIERVELAASAPAADTGIAAASSAGSWLDDVDAAADIAGTVESGSPERAAGSWLDEPIVDTGIAASTDAVRVDAPAVDAAPHVSASGLPGEPSPDAVAVRQLILDALASGQPRESIEAYLRDQLGLVEPGALIDATLAGEGS